MKQRQHLQVIVPPILTCTHIGEGCYISTCALYIYYKHIGYIYIYSRGSFAFLLHTWYFYIMFRFFSSPLHDAPGMPPHLVGAEIMGHHGTHGIPKESGIRYGISQQIWNKMGQAHVTSCDIGIIYDNFEWTWWEKNRHFHCQVR